MYQQPPAGHPSINRRSSISCSSPPAHTIRNAPFPADDGVVASRRLPAPALRDEEDEVDCGWETSMEIASVDTPPSSACSPQLTDQEVTYDIYAYILELMEPGGVDASLCFERAALLPPITAESLAELDMHRIINNPKLRHDVNFDRDLHFRPNLDGSKGRQKIKSADAYWTALEGEFFMYSLTAVRRAEAANEEAELYWRRVLQGSQRRLRKIFEVIRDVLQTLVPDCEQRVVAARMDVDLIMQEISNGVCDLVDLSTWLATVLQAHCAPMRDGLVATMKQELHDGACNGNNEKLVTGLRRLMAILEAMKLDVANHQIRHMRPLLIDDTINFQRRYNAHRIAIGKVDIGTARTWFDDELDMMCSAPAQQPHQLIALTSALFKDILFNELNAYPQTFYLDLDRLRLMRIGLHGRVYHDICQGILTDFLPVSLAATEIVQARMMLQDSIASIAGSHGRFCERLENIAAEMVRIILILERRDSTCDAALNSIVESRLESEFGMTSPSFESHARVLCDRMLPKLQASVLAHSRLSAFELQDVLLPSPANSHAAAHGFGAVCVPATPVQSFDPDDEIIRRMTHVICLHWHIWADLVYTAPLEEVHPVSSEMFSTPPVSIAVSVAVSPAASLVQSMVEPGKERAPISLVMTEAALLPTPDSTPSPGSSLSDVDLDEMITDHATPDSHQYSSP